MIAISFLFGLYFLWKDLSQKEALGYYTRQKNTLINAQHPAKILPSQTLGTLTLLNTICGLAIGKLFYFLETSNELDNIHNLFLLAGINYYGSFMGMLISSALFFYRNNINPISVFDSASPGFMLSYSIGRLGCHISGDGDWGIANAQPNPLSWLPDWLWSYNYPHNLAREGIIINYCIGTSYKI